MEGLLEFCDSDFKVAREKSFRLHLSYCYELKVLKETNESDFISLVNRLLNEPSTRRQGIYLLRIYLSQNSSQIVCENLVSWCSQVFKGTRTDIPVSYDVLSRLIELSIEFPESRKHVDQVFLAKLVNSILSLTKNDISVSALKCLESCLHYYSRACKNLAESIENYLLNIIDNEEKIVSAAGRCFAKVIASKTSDYWFERHCSLLKTFSGLMDTLFENVGEVKGSDPVFPESNRLKMPSVPSAKQVSLLVHFQRLATQFCNLAKYFEKTVLVGADIYRPIAVESVMELVSRALAVTTSTLASRPSAESSCLSAQIPMIHRAALGILNALILSGQTNLLPYSSSISKILSNVLKETDPQSNDLKPFEFVREKCYISLKSWLRVNGTAPSLMPHIKIILASITADIKVSKVSVSLNISAKKEEKKKKGKKNIRMSSQVVSGRSISSSDALCLAALSSLKLLISSAACIMLPEDHRTLQEMVIKLLVDLIQSKDLPYPYSVSECRGELYSCLSGLCISPHPGFPPPLHYAQFIFHSGLSDKSPLVTQRCSDALASIGHLLRPPCPSFNFPIDVSGMQRPKSPEKDMDDTNISNPPPEYSNKPSNPESKSIMEDVLLTEDNGSRDGIQSQVAPSVVLPHQHSALGEHINLDTTTSSNPTVIDSPPLSPSKEEVTIVSDNEENTQPSSSKRQRNPSEANALPSKRIRETEPDVVLVSDDEKSSSDCEIVESEVSKQTDVYEIPKTPTITDYSDAEMEEMLSSFVDSIP